MKSYLSNLFVICAIAFVFPMNLSAAELKGGVARVDLTPPMELKSPLGGYGARMNAPAEGVHDRIFGKAVVFSDGEKKYALVTADMLGFPPPFKQAVLDQLVEQGWAEENVMLLPSHSHTSIEMNAINPSNIFGIPQIGIYNPELFKFTVSKFVKLIQEAEKELVPIQVGTSRQQLPGWNRNRRSKEGVVDDALTVTRIDTTQGKPLAVLINFTAHPTFMSSKEMLFSGDWPGYLQRTTESIIGDEVTVMYHNGAQGDQSVLSRPDSGGSRWERAEKYGQQMGVIVSKQWNSISTNPDVIFEYHFQTFKLPKPDWHPDFMKTGGTEYGLTKKLLAVMLPIMYPAKTGSGCLQVGDLAIVGVPGEMTASLGLEIKAAAEKELGVKYPVIGGLADEWISYILPPDEYDKGGYEASVSFYGRTLGTVIVEGAVAGLKNMESH